MQVLLSKNAQKQYKKLPKTEQVKIKKKLKLLTTDAYAGKSLEGLLKGRRSLRAWPYRIIYTINIDSQTVEVSSIEHRQGVYK